MKEAPEGGSAPTRGSPSDPGSTAPAWPDRPAPEGTPPSRRRARCDQPVAPRPQSQMRHRRLFGDPRDRRFVHLVLGDPFVQWPHPILARIAGKRRAERNHRFHLVRVVTRILAGEEAAETPAD